MSDPMLPFMGTVATAGPERPPGGYWVLYIDGGARGNPGPAGAGAVLYDETGQKAGEDCYLLGHRTNNAAEYEGLVRGLDLALKAGATRLEIRSDSELLVRQMRGEYRTRAQHLKEAAERARVLLGEFSETRFTAIPRERNTEADLLANRAMDSVERNAREKERTRP